ncbi:hypothetical protein SELMODRAFT_406290 [Selaginella moellendorffii]|uniref:Cadmium-induced protein AS8 n=1 Tax=Selaginella moellendorffii TaxID=88036 RepID=D8R1W4_SELML|nr:uncharacterized protein LOC9663222 [Selaginella moellendorffii]EFJ33622.1 hypothetical protein SELMODRAFT_406290 [Selaginella moellendorffii]|eukprot:XP_024540835.1 uncharacterized protein LOC9663222 [Selaginella moellendorffii]
MTLINLFRRYERWNPVHPTYGAFWGIGFGLGCGVGWGPGFGPEVIGYVGSGCGVGISVGVTMVGVGVGLPAGGLACVPSDVVSYAGHGIMDFTKSTAAPAASIAVKRGWSALCLHIGTALERGRLGHSSRKSYSLDEFQRQSLVALRQGWDSFSGKVRSAGLSRLRPCNAGLLQSDSNSNQSERPPPPS